MMKTILIVCAAAEVSFAAAAGAGLWAKWVTGDTRVSVWDNHAQVDEEKAHPDPSGNHPFAVETRWAATELVNGAPAGTEWVLMEMGDAPFVGPDGGYMVLFGLTSEGDNVRLRSYDTGNDAVRSLVSALHDNHAATGPALDFSALSVHPLEILYKYGYNATQKETLFFGTGEGKLSDGGYMKVQESVAQEFVAPLELYYDSSGSCLTPYHTPVVYKRVQDDVALAATAAGAGLWAKWVTGDTRVSVWDNHAQVDEEKAHPDPSGNHPFAVETRWAATELVNGASAGTEWVLMEMG